MNDHHRLTIGLLKLFDLFLVMLSFTLTTISRVNAEHNVPLGYFLSLRAKISNLAILLLAFVVCHTIFSLCGLYRSRRLSGRGPALVVRPGLQPAWSEPAPGGLRHRVDAWRHGAT